MSARLLKTIIDDGKIVRTEKSDLGPPEGFRYGLCQKGIEYAKIPLPPSSVTLSTKAGR